MTTDLMLAAAAQRRVRRPLWERGSFYSPHAADDAGNNIPALIVASSGCWLWTGALTRTGYAWMPNQRLGPRRMAHRVIWEDFNGPVPENKQLDHICRERSCVNPAHLRVVTCRENLLEPRSQALAAINARKETCPRGHRYNAIRRRTNGKTYRTCNVCALAYYYRRKAQ